MPLLGQAALLLSFDVAASAIADHDDWHTHEHLPERLSIPGFLRGTRWVAPSGQPRYFIMYEVATLGTLTSDAYLARLNNPTPWTARIMVHYRNMRRGFCAITASLGLGFGHAGLLIRFKPAPDAAAGLRKWLASDVLPELPSRKGIGSVHLFEQAVAPPMTQEQSIRGADAGIDWAIFATGYDADALAALSGTVLDAPRLAEQGATGVQTAHYRIDYSLSQAENQRKNDAET